MIDCLLQKHHLAVSEQHEHGVIMRQLGWGPGFMQVGSVKGLNLSSTIPDEVMLRSDEGFERLTDFLPSCKTEEVPPSNQKPGRPTLSDIFLSPSSPTPTSFPYLQPLPVCFLLPSIIKHTQVFLIFAKPSLP